MRGPHGVRVRYFDVGFGDCFLLSFDYAPAAHKVAARHVLIDFGTTAGAHGQEAPRLNRIAKEIARECGGKLTAVVATHRHRDHINGFARWKDGKGPGDKIHKLKPDVMLQPWTEDPALKADADGPLRLPRNLSRTDLEIAERNLNNKRAVKGLRTIGVAHRYLCAGMEAGLARLLPGVRVRVLGPSPGAKGRSGRLRQALDGARGTDAGKGGVLFPAALQWNPCNAPPQTRWFVEKLHTLRREQFLGLVRALDSELNNTSLILLFEVAGRKLLFGGDAETEAWANVLNNPRHECLIRGVDLYKVSHHGSRNGTTPELWRTLAPRHTLLSAREGMHGDERTGSEVPNQILVKRFKDESTLWTTSDLRRAGQSSGVIEIPLR